MPYTKEKRKAYDKARAKERRAAGLCHTWGCKQPARPGKTRCQKCADEKR